MSGADEPPVPGLVQGIAGLAAHDARRAERIREQAPS